METVISVMRSNSWTAKQSSANGWNGVHFYVHGKMVCTTPSKGMHIDLRGIMNLEHRKPKFVKQDWKPRDCKNCTARFLELMFYFQSIPNLGVDRILR